MTLNQKSIMMAYLDVARRKFRVAHKIHTPLNTTLEEGYWREVADQMMCVLELELWGREIIMDRNVVTKNNVPSSLKAYLWQELYNRVPERFEKLRKRLFAKITFEPRTHEEHVHHWHMCPHTEYPAEHRYHVHFLASKEPYEGSVAELKALREMQRVLLDERDPIRAEYEARRVRMNFERRAA